LRRGRPAGRDPCRQNARCLQGSQADDRHPGGAPSAPREGARASGGRAAAWYSSGTRLSRARRACRECKCGSECRSSVLAAARLDHDPGNNRLRNLRSLCQRCHIIQDRPYHLAQRRITYVLRRALALPAARRPAPGQTSTPRGSLSLSATPCSPRPPMSLSGRSCADLDDMLLNLRPNWPADSLSAPCSNRCCFWSAPMKVFGA